MSSWDFVQWTKLGEKYETKGECRLFEKESVLRLQWNTSLFLAGDGAGQQIEVRLSIGETYLCRFLKVEKKKPVENRLALTN